MKSLNSIFVSIHAAGAFHFFREITMRLMGARVKWCYRCVLFQDDKAKDHSHLFFCQYCRYS